MLDEAYDVSDDASHIIVEAITEMVDDDRYIDVNALLNKVKQVV